MPRKRQRAERILLRSLFCYGGQVADSQSIRHHSRSAEFSIITSVDDVFIFYFTESIFFHRDIIRDIGKKGKGYSTRRIRSSVQSSNHQSVGLAFNWSLLDQKKGVNGNWEKSSECFLKRNLTIRSLNFTRKEKSISGARNEVSSLKT